MTEKPKRRNRKRRSHLSWSAKHAARVEFYPSMAELLEWMKPFAMNANLAAQDLSAKHGLESHVSLLIALRESINQRIADEVRKIMARRKDDLADIKILIWQVTQSARIRLEQEAGTAELHLAEGLHPQYAQYYNQVGAKEVQ